MTYLGQLFSRRKMIFDLAKNDFNKKFKGSYLGAFWAFVNPIITILVYWFVFEIGFRSGVRPEGYPFVLWLICGMVPWFFFSEALTSATTSFSEYSFLVKKVVFKISILPFIKILSSLFIHLFFILFMAVILLIYGFMPTLSWLQILYYAFCTIALLMGVGFTSASILPFFKDMAQVISIVIQIGFWLTPIVWSLDIVPGNLQFLFELNPFYYIAEGYRDAFLNNRWFWEKPFDTLYFWFVTIIFLAVAVTIFRKLKPHFSDVL